MTARSAPARPEAPRLTPAQDLMLRDCERHDHQTTSHTYKPAIRLAALGFIEAIEKRPYANMRTWRITAAGRAWLAAREGRDGR